MGAICEICGSRYDYSCSKCTRRVTTWGVDGAYQIIQLARRTDDIDAKDLLAFVMEYYNGRTPNKRDAVTILKTSLRLLGYSGGFVGRIHKNGESYKQLRARENTAGKRWRLRKDSCEKCGSTDELRLHHIVPLAWGGKTSDENCITLCEKCHRATHRKLSSTLNRAYLLSILENHRSDIYERAHSTTD